MRMALAAVTDSSQKPGVLHPRVPSMAAMNTDVSPRRQFDVPSPPSSHPLSTARQPFVPVSVQAPSVENSPQRHNSSNAPSPASTMFVARGIFTELDQAYFGGANGDETKSAAAVAMLDDSSRTKVLLMMYSLLHQTLQAAGPAPADFVGPSASECHSPEQSMDHPSFSRLGSAMPRLLAANSMISRNDLLSTSRTPSQISMGGSIVSMSNYLPVHTTTAVQKSVDEESGNKKINEYLILGDIGRGTQGKVKVAYDMIREQLRAIKIIRRPRVLKHPRISGEHEEADSEKRLSSLEREIAIAKRIRHRNLVSLFEVIDDPEHEKLFLVFEHVDSRPIATLRESFCERYDDIRMVGIARQITAGLAYLHAHGVVHRDIKPENILRGDGDIVHVIDFGVSELLDADALFDEEKQETDSAAGSAWTRRRETATSRRVMVRGTVGTPAFMAPELLDAPSSLNTDGVRPHQNHSGFALDIWALGVTIFALLCGRLPWVVASLPTVFGTFQMKQYFETVVSSPPQFPPSPEVMAQAEVLKKEFGFEERAEPLPRPWVELLTAMLSRDPEQRPTIAVVRKKIKAMRIGQVGVGFRRSDSSGNGSVPVIPPGALQKAERRISGVLEEQSLIVSSSPTGDQFPPETEQATSTTAPSTAASTRDSNCSSPMPPASCASPSTLGTSTETSFSVKRRRRTRPWVEEE